MMSLVTLVTDASIRTQCVNAFSVATKIWYCIALINKIKREKNMTHKLSSFHSGCRSNDSLSSVA
jgi:hypothetical protein